MRVNAFYFGKIAKIVYDVQKLCIDIMSQRGVNTLTLDDHIITVNKSNLIIDGIPANKQPVELVINILKSLENIEYPNSL